MPAHVLTSVAASRNVLTAVASSPQAGTFPGVYPGATTFPGSGTNIGAAAITPNTLTEAPA